MEVGEVDGGFIGGRCVGKIEIFDSNEIVGGGVLVFHFLFFLQHFDNDVILCCWLL